MGQGNGDNSHEPQFLIVVLLKAEVTILWRGLIKYFGDRRQIAKCYILNIVIIIIIMLKSVGGNGVT